MMNETERLMYLEKDERILETRIRPLVNKELINEHRKKPIGEHSPELISVLNFFRRHHEEIAGKYLIICTKKHEQWCLGEHPGERGKPYILFEDECFDSREAAEHGLFIKRLKKYDLWKDEYAEGNDK